ncbi:MAG: polyprenol monophosphomannose synthase [Chloroflexaceae bacterium]|jgi:dolichol-phosphate mannosyltransferase|nr:polyprenol monophosphomannose synthase [Chloroflexaceae bacterium]
MNSLQPTDAAPFHAAGDSRNHCLVVIPTYNEADNIVRLLREVLAQGPQFDVLVVDDNSPDGTAYMVQAIAEQTPRVRLLQRAGKLGLGTAYLAGFEQGLQRGYSYICEMDADFSHQPHYLPLLLATAEREADVAIGSRNVPGGRVENWSLLRQFISRGGSRYARTILGMPVRDCTGGFKCFRASALRRVNLAAVKSNGYAFQVELNYRCHQAGLHLREVPIIFPDRVAGQSKMSSRIVLEAALMVWRMRFSPAPASTAHQRWQPRTRPDS